MKNRFVWIIAILSIIIIAVAIFILGAKPSATDKDIEIEAVLQLNNTGICDYKEYALSINMIKNKDSNIIIYPYIMGLGQISFSEKGKDDYYLPGSVGSDGITERIAINRLKSENIIQNETDISLIGFWFPDNVGQYKTRLYLSKLDSFTEIKNPVLVCVYIEEKYGKQLTWSKIVPITMK